LALAMVFGATACGPEPPPRPSFIEAESHAHYAAALGEFGLDKAALGRDWLQAASRALTHPIPVTLPFSETGYLPPSTPTALAYQFDMRRGRRLVIDLLFDADPDARLFVELFEVVEDAEPRRVAEAQAAERRIEFEARRDGPYLLRIQPELLRGGRVTATERTTASLGFPVQGLSIRAVQSVFGDPRDAGARDHHGVDIFAPRGTPVLAAVDGVVRVDTGNRGGQLIWLTSTASSTADSSRRRGRRLYYAHLDGWAVEDGQRVSAGDVIGYVGNTGNARTKPPHLHFGVYDRGPVDPAPFLRPDDPAPGAMTGSLDALDAWVRVTRAGSVLRDAAHLRGAERARLERDVVARVLAASGGYYRVATPDGVWGYLSVADVVLADASIGRTGLALAEPLRASPHPRGSIIDTIVSVVDAEVLGRHGDFQLVRLPDARIGWVAASPAGPPPGL
jgi:murein DD-endopeptidase MepM/ murein hydrolase activator NlpD